MQVTSKEIKAVLQSPLHFAKVLTANQAEEYRSFDWLKYVTKRMLLPITADLINKRPPSKRIHILEAPVRHGKTELLSSIFPAYILALRPEFRVILYMHKAEIAQQYTQKVRDLYLTTGHTITGWKPVGEHRAPAGFWRTPQGGSYMARGVGTGISGLGAQLQIIDDPFANAKEAMSPAVRKSVINWFKADIINRSEPNSIILLTHARWHEDDLIGHIKRQYPDQVNSIRLPAIAEQGDPMGRDEGQPLCIERFDIPELNQRKETVGPYFFKSLYQQQPSDPEGAVFRREKFNHYDQETINFGKSVNYKVTIEGKEHLLKEDEAFRFTVTDTAKTVSESSDWTVISCWDLFSVDDQQVLCLKDIIRKRLETPDILPHIQAAQDKWQPHTHYVEGVSETQFLQREGFNVQELKPKASKWIRAQPAIAMIESQRMWFPSKATWLELVEQELSSFPLAAHDDIVDVVAYAAQVSASWSVGIYI